jgi:[ribosomal protein S18]-alanine N-acetyltransferase
MLMVRPRLWRSKRTIVSIPRRNPPSVEYLWKTRRYGPERDHKAARPHPRCVSHRYNGGVPFVIRDFQPTDFDALWSIDQECFPPGISYSEAELKLYIRRRGSFTLVAVDAAAESLDTDSDADLKKKQKNSSILASSKPVAGFLVAEADTRGHGHIITLDVIAAARRFGVGSLLIRTAEDRLGAAGCHSVELETAVDNISALSFYKRHGYSVISTSPRYYSNGVDALVLEKDLSADRVALGISPSK